MHRECKLVIRRIQGIDSKKILDLYLLLRIDTESHLSAEPIVHFCCRFDEIFPGPMLQIVAVDSNRGVDNPRASEERRTLLK